MSLEDLRFKRLIKELSFLKSDLEYHTAEYEERRKIFYIDYNEFLEDSEYEFSEEKTVSQMRDIFNPVQQGTPIEKESDLTKQNKDIFKKIAKKTHPDLHSDQDKTIMFKNAVKAVENGDWYTLYTLSESLGIEIEEYSPAHIEWIKSEINKTKEIIKDITITFEWIYSEPNANKQAVLTNYCKITCNKK